VFTALLGTCVLWPSTQRDFLLSLAAEGLYRPVWSSDILGELEYEEKAKLVGRGVDTAEADRRARYLVAEMRRAFDDAEVVGYRGLEGTYGLPDRDDEHVVAAAVVGGAGAIVTVNVRHSPAENLPEGLDVLTPGEFAHNTVALAPTLGLRALRAIAGRSGRHGPPITEAEVLLRLEERYGMHDAVQLIREALGG
jgi:hypothetical protein